MVDRITLIVPAAGFGRRMGGAVAKQYLSLAGEPMLVHTLRRAAREEVVEGIILVVPTEEVEWCREEIVNRYRIEKVHQVVAGGQERQDSVFNGLRHLPPTCEWVAVHDGARPLLPPGLLARIAAELDKYQAVIAAVPVIDTIKQANDELQVEATLERSRLWAVQTPQAFSAKLLKRAHKEAREAGCYATDDAALVERLGIPVGIVIGSYDNFKVTTREDLDRAETILSLGQTGGSGSGMRAMGIANRVGIGYDVHRLAEGRKLILGGIEIPYSHGLLGHSDADVLTHAVIDALLGALALGDLGEHFPDTDPRYAGISSLELLEAVYNMVEERGYRVGNLDCVIAAERPKLAPFRGAMRETLARVLRAEPQQVSVKATTTEGLGFTGRQEGIAANAVVILIG